MANTFISLSSFRRGCRCRGGYPYRQESSGPEGRRCYDFYCQGHPGRRRRQAQDEVRRAAWCGTPYTERRGKHRVGRRRREPGLPGQPSVPGRAEPHRLLQQRDIRPGRAQAAHRRGLCHLRRRRHAAVPFLPPRPSGQHPRGLRPGGHRGAGDTLLSLRRRDAGIDKSRPAALRRVRRDTSCLFNQ